jgi:5-amino-6-(5-phosphoribosylamino)uracil reductase/diaminohydroxyphosphoribosylaminopyrimidine deaminase/5-amino-6-(5-phosphoribosylamino)uracil reductase
MACELEKPVAAALWPSLLAFKRFLDRPESRTAGPVAFWREPSGDWRFTPDPSALDGAGADQALLVPLPGRGDASRETPRPDVHRRNGRRTSTFLYERFVDGRGPFVHPSEQRPERRFLTFFRIYLPLLLGGYLARKEERVFISAHLAQTLDGRIACRNGHSQWISNEANLHHAHRLRALHPAVVIGARTVEHDDPQLTVRHVEGKDPVRIILNASGSVIDAGRSFRVFDGAGSTVLCSPARATRLARQGKPGRVRVVPLECRGDALISPETICRALRRCGHHAVFVEGGAFTLSRFLELGLIDVLHIHIAPMILGSGINSISLPEVKRVQEGRHVQMEHFTLDGELLLECRGARPRGAPAAD